MKHTALSKHCWPMAMQKKLGLGANHLLIKMIAIVNLFAGVPADRQRPVSIFNRKSRGVAATLIWVSSTIRDFQARFTIVMHNSWLSCTTHDLTANTGFYWTQIPWTGQLNKNFGCCCTLENCYITGVAGKNSYRIKGIIEERQNCEMMMWSNVE